MDSLNEHLYPILYQLASDSLVGLTDYAEACALPITLCDVTHCPRLPGSVLSVGCCQISMATH